MARKDIREPVTGGRVKVPVIMQMEATECGAASLCMVLAYYDKWIPLEQMRQDCGISRDGSKLGNIMKAASAYGLKTDAYSWDTEYLREHGAFPCILFWEFNHFVVCDGFRGNYALLNDPARGDVQIPIEQFEESYTGVCLLLRPGGDFQPSGRPVSMLAYAADKMKKTRATLLFVAWTTAIISLLGLLMTGFSRVFLDRMLTGLEKDWLRPFFLCFCITALIYVMTAWIQAIYSLKLNGRMGIEGSSSYMWKLLRLPMGFFGQRYAGDLLARKRENAAIAGDITDIVAPTAINAVMMAFYFIAMVRYSRVLTLICVGTIALQLWAFRVISRKRVNMTRVMMRDQVKLDSTTLSAVAMIEDIKASGAENGYFEMWAGYQASANRQSVRYEKLNQVFGMVPEILSTLMNALILLTGIWLVIRGDFTSGMLLAFQGLLASFIRPAQSLIESQQKLQQLRTRMERIEDVMKYPEDIMLPAPGEEAGAVPVKEGKLRGRIEMRDVTFGYSPLEAPLIEHFNLVVEPGKSVAFVGGTGCGKSTLTRLLSGLYQPWSGEILLDGKPLTEIDRRILTASLAVVEQDITLFEDTVENNIKLWDRTIEDFEMILAARDARIHENILKKEGGYQSMILEGGGGFSGGERQRIGIAGALVKDPSILIMDEATSALDSGSEYEITKAVRDRGITRVIVAHRLSTIRDCDEIIVMDHGKAVERGTHESLMELNGLYKELVMNA